jgi:hypothetical protein
MTLAKDLGRPASDTGQTIVVANSRRVAIFDPGEFATANSDTLRSFLISFIPLSFVNLASPVSSCIVDVRRFADLHIRARA